MKSTVKQTIIKFMQAWIDNDFQKMYEHCQLHWIAIHKKNDLKKMFIARIKRYEIVSVREVNPFMYDVEIKYTRLKKVFKTTARVICEEEKNKASLNGKWRINPISMLR